MADGGGMFDSFFKKASASVKVLAKDAVQSTATLVNKVAETDVQGVARRLQHKVMEKADANYANVEELPEVESAMLNLKQTDQAYRELHAVLLETFVAQCKAANRQLRAANRAQVIGLDLETEAVGSAMGSFGNHLTVSAERSQELHSVKEGAEVEERARDDFGSRVYDTPAAKLVSSLASFIQTELAQALVARTKYKDSRREVLSAPPAAAACLPRAAACFTLGPAAARAPQKEILATLALDPFGAAPTPCSASVPAVRSRAGGGGWVGRPAGRRLSRWARRRASTRRR